MTKPTKAQHKILAQALSHPLGLVEPSSSWGGLQRAGWHATMSRVVAAGWFKPYVHGGYEITNAGREIAQS